LKIINIPINVCDGLKEAIRRGNIPWSEKTFSTEHGMAVTQKASLEVPL
jgi:hypothetical protein